MSPAPGAGVAWLSRQPGLAKVPGRALPDPAPPYGGVPDRAVGGPGDGSAGDVLLPGPGGVATWLPEGRWATGDAAEDAPVDRVPVPAGPEEAGRRRGRRRVRWAQVASRLSGWPRRVAAALLLVGAVVATLRPDGRGSAIAPAAPARAVVVTSRDLAAGTVIAPADLRSVSMPVAVVPSGAADRPAMLVGRVVAGPVRRGEPLTDARVVGPGLTAGLGPGGTAAVPVRLAEPETAALVRAGDRVDVLGTAVTPDGTGAAPAGDAREIASGVRVLAVLRGGPDGGVVLVVAATAPVARRLAGAAARQRLTVAVRPP